MNRTSPLLAWEVSIDDVRCIVFAATKPKAQWIAVRSYREAGYGRSDVWPRPRASRQPRFDASPLKDRPQQAWSEDYVLNCP